MRFCSQCAAPIVRKIPTGDQLPRNTCPSCGQIYYENPKIVVGAIVEANSAILLCKRAISPRKGWWTLPAGFMENGESTAQGAARETLEEAGVQPTIDDLICLVDIPEIHQVHLFFRGRAPDQSVAPGPESLAAGYFEESEIPWENIAFQSVGIALRHYLTDRHSHTYRMHTVSIAPDHSPSDW